MSDFSLQKEKKKKKIVTVDMPLNGFCMKPKLKKHTSLIDVNEIVLVQENAKKQMIEKQFNRTYRKLIAMVYDVMESDSSSASDCVIALNEVAKVADMLKRKYQKDLQKKELEKLLKKCWLLDNQLRQKLLEIRTNMMINQMAVQNQPEEEKGRGR